MGGYPVIFSNFIINGPAHLKALRDVFRGSLWCPAGGLGVGAVPDWFAAGAKMAGLGGPLIKGGIAAKPANVAAFLAPVAQAAD